MCQRFSTQIRGCDGDLPGPRLLWSDFCDARWATQPCEVPSQEQLLQLRLPYVELRHGHVLSFAPWEVIIGFYRILSIRVFLRLWISVKNLTFFPLRHIREKHENPILNCPFCDYTSKYKQNLRRHIRVHHEAARYVHSGFGLAMAKIWNNKKNF